MKWLVAGFLVCLMRHGSGGAIKCLPTSVEPECAVQVKGLPISQEESRLESKPEQATIPEEVMVPEVVTSPEVHEAECLAGSEWISHCYSCQCSPHGLAHCIRKDGCIDPQDGKPIRCKPNTTFQRGCNTCTCLENGLGLCSLQPCNTVHTAPAEPKLQGHDCASGTTWTFECGTCVCTHDGWPQCTNTGCSEEQAELQMKCAPESRWKDDCNHCQCSRDGKPLCTQINCLGFDTPSGSSISFNDKAQELDEAQIEKESQMKSAAENNISDADWELTHNVVKRSQVCKPNASFQSDCNTCKCAGDGLSYRCTQNECMDKEEGVDKGVEVFMESEGVDHIERHSVCRAQTVFYIGCNTCHCNYDGTDYTCTNKPCPLPDDVEIFHELRALKSAQNKTVVCVANRMFIKDCNTCWCNEDGTGFFCTRKVCVSEQPEEGFDFDKPEELRVIQRTCRPDEVFEIDCNMCRCNPDGKSFSCTRRACAIQETAADEVVQYPKNASSRKTRAATQEPPRKACQPGQEFRMDCNKCLCDFQGQDFSCTRMDCRALSPASSTRRKRDVTQQQNASCTPGSVFEQGCNVCRCNDDGKHATCTIKSCVKSTEETQCEVPEADPNFRCYPGEQFKRSCNDCTCSADGKSVFCTLRVCDKDLPSDF